MRIFTRTGSRSVSFLGWRRTPSTPKKLTPRSAFQKPSGPPLLCPCLLLNARPDTELFFVGAFMLAGRSKTASSGLKPSRFTTGPESLPLRPRLDSSSSPIKLMYNHHFFPPPFSKINRFLFARDRPLASRATSQSWRSPFAFTNHSSRPPGFLRPPLRMPPLLSALLLLPRSHRAKGCPLRTLTSRNRTW